MKKVVSVLGAVFLLAGSVSSAAIFASKEEVYTPTFATYSNGDADTYYNGISDTATGTELLKSLQQLNASKRRSTVGYGSMGTSASKQFKYTDYDPSTVKYDSNNQPYGTKVLSFYSGNSTTSFNREHVWPNSHGGNSVEDDIHMPRPTIPAENGSRGNSFYVEGKKDSSRGWDPAMEDFGKEDYRGDSARIIFYCCVADSRLSLIDDEYHATSNSNKDNLMGKLSDMIKWHLNYPVLQREKNRNEGAEYLQGNRNPFIDHPEYVCRIWGNTNAATKALCGGSGNTNTQENPTSITLNKSSASIKIDETVQLNVASVTPSGANNSVTWSSENSNIASVSATGLVTGKGEGTVKIIATSTVNSTVKAECSITVTKNASSGGDDDTPVASGEIVLNQTTAELKPGDTLQLTATSSSGEAVSGITWSSSSSKVATVSEDGLVTALIEGKAYIVARTADGKYSATCTVNISKTAGGIKVNCGGNIIATSVILSTISLLGVALLLVKKYKEN